MKCPKCHYLGFETGERCKNCGYDFSLLSDRQRSEADPEAASHQDLDLGHAPDAADQTGALDLRLRSQAEAEDARPALPLFRADDDQDDEPLVRVAEPRAPVAVRKTPAAQRIRLTDLSPPAPMHEAVFEFGSEPAAGARSSPPPAGETLAGTTLADRFAPIRSALGQEPGDATRADAAAGGEGWLRPHVERADEGPVDASSAVPVARTLPARALAALIDYGLLLAIDVVVLHFTLRLTALTWSEWQVLPLAPLVLFLVGLKLAYLTVFTLAGGQTIGKMATGLAVVDDQAPGLRPWQAVHRAVLEIASVAALGLPFALALTDPARRGLHDRLAGTRVVAVP